MSHTIDRLLRTALAGGVATLLVASTPVLAVAGTATDGAAPLRLAQTAPKSGARQPQAQPAQPQGQPPGGAQDVERQISDLKKRLNITQVQQAQFDAFAQAMRQNAQATDAAAQQAQQSQTHNAVEDLRIAVKMAEAEADGLKRLLPALEALYTSLSDQQKKTADQVLAGDQQPEQPPPQQGKRR